MTESAPFKHSAQARRMPFAISHVLGNLYSIGQGIWCVMWPTGMALLVAPGAGRDDILGGIRATIGLGQEMFGRAAKVLGQPDRYAQLLGMQPATLLPDWEPAIEATAVLVK